jgi:hypothetical protein
LASVTGTGGAHPADRFPLLPADSIDCTPKKNG